MDTETDARGAPRPTIDLARPYETLRCRADGCTGSPFSPTSGWHMVNAVIEGRPHSGPCLFVCTAHLALAEDTLARHMDANEPRAWQVATFRMQCWVADGRGKYYIAAAGGGDPTLF